jgi:hypothetical protein
LVTPSEYLVVVATASDCSLDLGYRVACLNWFSLVWFSEEAAQLTANPSANDVLSVLCVVHGVMAALAVFPISVECTSDGQSPEALDVEVAITGIESATRLLRFIVLSDAVDDYFKQPVGGESLLLRLLRIVCDYTTKLIHEYASNDSTPSEYLSMALVHFLEVLELFTADSNAYVELGEIMYVELVGIASLNPDTFKAKWLSQSVAHKAVRDHVFRRVARTTSRELCLPAVSLFRILGNLHDVSTTHKTSTFSLKFDALLRKTASRVNSTANLTALLDELGDGNDGLVHEAGEQIPTLEEVTAFSQFYNSLQKEY